MQALTTSRYWRFFGRLSVLAKINLTVGLIFILVIATVTYFTSKREKERILDLATHQTIEMSTMYFDSLNTMMLTGTMSQRNILREKMLRRPNVIETRVIRGQPVKGQFGEGFVEEQVVDELDLRALKGEEIKEVRNGEKGRVLTVVTPFKATTNTRGVNCLQCHQVPENAINGAIRVSYSLEELDSAINTGLMQDALANLVLMSLGLICANFLLKGWITQPLRNLMTVIALRSTGDNTTRAAVKADDEIGKLASEFNQMSDKVNESLIRERELQEQERRTNAELQAKVDKLLEVVNMASKGDLSGKIAFSGEDAIGKLADGLQLMIDNLKALIEGKAKAMAELRSNVDAILKVVSQAAEGDLTGNLNLRGEDDVVMLAQGVQRMVDNLGALVMQVQQSGIQVTSASTEIAATAKQQEATASEQAATANEVVAAATQISATSKELFNTMTEVSKVAESTAQSAQNGQLGLEKMGANMHKIADASKAIATKLEVLNEKASNISTVITTITKVADQTNLLSLNAAIEAEKAGEYGVGFAVVATEIRRLADQTAVATLDIERMVKEMQSAVAAGVMGVEKFSEDVKSSVQEVETVGAQLSKIIDQVRNLTPRYESVYDGMQAQSLGAEQIKEAIIQLNESVQQTVESLEQSNSVIERLNDAAHALQSSVSRFKVVRKDKVGERWLGTA